MRVISSTNTAAPSYQVIPTTKQQTMQKGVVHFGIAEKTVKKFLREMENGTIKNHLTKLTPVGLKSTWLEALLGKKAPTAEEAFEKINALVKKKKITDAYNLYELRINGRKDILEFKDQLETNIGLIRKTLNKYLKNDYKVTKTMDKINKLVQENEYEKARILFLRESGITKFTKGNYTLN